jgi:glutamate 5-kinase
MTAQHTMTEQNDRLAPFGRVVVKVGSALLTGNEPVAASGVSEDWLASLAADIAGLRARGTEVLVVSSGAIAIGRAMAGFGKRLRLEENQAAAAIGQIGLARAWEAALGGHKLRAAQILLTLADTEERRRYLNARATLETLLRVGAIPVVNENDTVATTEIRYGDNDRLAARVATMASADLLILLSDVAGLYTAPPGSGTDAKLIPHVPQITPQIEAIAGDAGSELSRGGMKTKIEAAKIATGAGTAMVIASGRITHPLSSIANGGDSTWFDARQTPLAARKAWIGGTLEPHGTIVLDHGACAAIRKGKSLLPAGVVSVTGTFHRGDAVILADANGQAVGRGLIAYDHDEASRIAGCNTTEIETRLGYAGRAAMVHRDDMVLMGDGTTEVPVDRLPRSTNCAGRSKTKMKERV